ncbi:MULTISPECIES: hypothetical protein [Actinokineospora]|uniref:hypothetical protein n=1 Tax=Actinokineospora TaxID=39845 RepID=UPI0016711925|nr:MULTISPECIES: hypothetical protein [Actinokineospora]
MTYYPQPPGAWPPPMPPRSPSGGAAVTAGVFALLLLVYCGYNIYMQVWWLLEGCGIACLVGIHMIPVVVLPLAALLLLIGAIVIFARAVAGPILTAIGAFLLLALQLMYLILSGFYLHVLTLVGLVLALVTLVMSLLPPTFAWTRSKPRFPAYPAPMPYPPRY